MTRSLNLGVLLAVAVALCGADQKAAAEKARPPKPAGARPGNPPRNNAGGNPKAAGGRKMPAPLTNPSNPVTRLYRATPEERDRALEKLPPAMQEQFRNQLRHFDNMTPEQQQAVLRQGERYAALPRDRQEAFRQALQALNKMAPEERRPVVAALRKLETLPDAERRDLLASEEFKSRFSPEELRILSDLSVVMLPPM